MPTIGRNSPTAPAGRMYLPNRPPSMSWSRRIGSSAPKAVVVSPRATGHEGVDEPGVRQEAGDRDREHGGDEPADDREMADPLPEQLEVELVAGEQEQEAEADVGDQLEARRVGQVEDLRPDDDAADDEHHDLRQPDAVEQGRDEGSHRRDDGDHEQADQPGPDVHRLTSSGHGVAVASLSSPVVVAPSPLRVGGTGDQTSDPGRASADRPSRPAPDARLGHGWVAIVTSGSREQLRSGVALVKLGGGQKGAHHPLRVRWQHVGARAAPQG